MTEFKPFFDAIKEQQITKLTDVGFTREQVEVLLEMMQTKSLFGGFI